MQTITVQQNKTAAKRQYWTHRQKWVLLVSFIVTLVGSVMFFATLNNPANDSPTNPSSTDPVTDWGLAIGAIGLLVLVWVLFDPPYKWWAGQVRIASAPIPDPLTIAQNLRVELGREPRLEEVAAVQTMLIHQRNEAAFKAAAAVAALYEMERLANGRRAL